MITKWMMICMIRNRARRNLGGALQSAQIFTKADFLLINNDSEKKKGAKKHTTGQIPRKLLVTLLLST